MMKIKKIDDENQVLLQGVVWVGYPCFVILRPERACRGEVSESWVDDLLLTELVRVGLTWELNETVSTCTGTWRWCVGIFGAQCFCKGACFVQPFPCNPSFSFFWFWRLVLVPGSYFKINLCFTRYSGLMHCGTRNDPFYTNHNDATHQNTIAYNRIERIPWTRNWNSSHLYWQGPLVELDDTSTSE